MYVRMYAAVVACFNYVVQIAGELMKTLVKEIDLAEHIAQTIQRYVHYIYVKCVCTYVCLCSDVSISTLCKNTRSRYNGERLY